MIQFRRGDILAAEAEALVNTVNCVGIMGRGIALQFKHRYPENFTAYAAACKREEVQPGKMFVFETGTLMMPRYIINFPTKRHWRDKSRLGDIRAGLDALVEEIEEKGIHSIAIPPLGSGLGGLDWQDVRPLIVEKLAGLPNLEVLVYEPSNLNEERHYAKPTAVPSMTAGRAVLLVLMERYLAGMMDVSVTLLEVHKLMYFMQEAGEELRLNYVKWTYGPYAEELRHVLRAIEGHMTSGYTDGGDAPTKELTLMPGTIDEAQDYLKEHLETRQRFDRVVDLVQGFETPFGLELLSTVHWVVTREGASTSEEAAKRVHAWGEKKQQFAPEQIAIALDTLTAKGWFPSSAPH